MNPHRSRVAAVFGARQGSGYLLGPRLVLTAAHVVQEEATAEVVVFGGVGEVLCDVVWRRKDNACDAALLAARSDIVPTEVAAGFAPLRWGELIRLDSQDNCQAIGFPLVQRDERGNLESEQLEGRVKPGSSILGGLYVLESSGIPPQPSADRSPWSGLSGAALFCRGALIGVVVTAPTGWNHGRVEAVPVRVIADDPGFRDALGQRSSEDVALEALDELSDQEREDHEFEVRYRHYVARHYGKVETLGHGSVLGRIVWPLDTAFLALELAETAPRRGPGRSAVEVATGKRVQTALRGRNRILLQGAAGSGKTTLMHWFAVRAAQGDLPSELGQLQGRVPFVVPLRALAASQGLPQAEDLLIELQYPVADSKPAGWLTRLLDQGRCLLLVDGIDEVQHDQRPRVRSWLEGLLALHPDTAVVVTSRPSAVPDDWLAGYGFTAFSVLPMSPADVGAFIDRWFAALQESEEWSWYWDRAEEYRGALRDTVSTRASLTEMAANPRLCTLICAVWLEQRGHLPEDPMSLHRAALDLLLGQRDTLRGITATEGADLELDPQASLLDELALWMTFDGATEITRRHAYRIVEGALRGVLEEDTEATLNHLLIRSGVLHETSPGTIAFEHSTFRDYFASHALVDRHHFGFLVNNAHDPQYEDIVRMAVGHCRRRQADQLLLDLVERGDDEPEHRTWIHLLATASLEYAAQVDPEVRREVLRRTEALIPPGDDAAADVLAEAGSVVLGLLPGPDGLTVEEARAVVLTACKIGGPAAATFLERFQGHADLSVRERVRWGHNRALLDRRGTLPAVLDEEAP